MNGFSWFGSDSKDYVVGGLQAERLATLVQEMKDLGFNTVRLLRSNELYERNPVGKYALTANPDMEGETGPAILDEVMAALAQAGILVILNNHSSDAEWCCKNDANSKSWFFDKAIRSSLV